MTDSLISPADVTSDTKPSQVFEANMCLRCDGSGYIRAFGHVHNGVCFGCNGAGRRLTKRGAEAQRYFKALGETALANVRPGDKVLAIGNGITSGTRWARVEAITSNAQDQRSGRAYPAGDPRIAEAVAQGATIKPSSLGDGHVAVYSGLNVETNATIFCGVSADSMYRVADPATSVARLKAAAEYQAALTKQGKPRKGSRYDKVAA